MTAPVDVRVADGVMLISLTRPEKRNALNHEMTDRIAEALAEAELSPEVRVIALRGAGLDFSAGADLTELLASVDQSMDQNEQDALRLGEIFLAMRRLPKPVVALVQGRALAGGAGLATAADLVLAARSSRFGYPEVERGFVPAMVMTMLRRCVGEKRAFDLIGTGRIITADEAASIGLVSRVVDDEAFDQEGANLLANLSRRPPTAAALTKQLFYDLDGRDFGDGILLGARVNALARRTDEFRRNIAEFLNR